MHMFISPFVYTNTQTHTNRNTKFLGGPRKESPILSQNISSQLPMPRLPIWEFCKSQA